MGKVKKIVGKVKKIVGKAKTPKTNLAHEFVDLVTLPTNFWALSTKIRGQGSRPKLRAKFVGKVQKFVGKAKTLKLRVSPLGFRS